MDDRSRSQTVGVRYLCVAQDLLVAVDENGIDNISTTILNRDAFTKVKIRALTVTSS